MPGATSDSLTGRGLTHFQGEKHESQWGRLSLIHGLPMRMGLSPRFAPLALCTNPYCLVFPVWLACRRIGWGDF